MEGTRNNEGGQGELAYIAAPLRPLAVPIADLRPDPSNARRHDERNVEAIVASLSRFGQRLPLVVQKQGMIVRAGNGRMQAAKSLGWTHLACVVVDEGSVDATAYAIADNRTAELATWDDETLASLLQSLPDDAKLAAGFKDDELKDLLDGLTPPEVVEDEPPAPLPTPVSRTGDLWVLGGHRLLCGDSTKAESWSALQIADNCVCFTSPPYNLGDSIKLRGSTTLAESGNAYVGHNDNVAAYGEFVQAMQDRAIEHCEAAVFNVQPVAGCKAELLRWIGNNADAVCDVVTWDKGHAAPQMAAGVLSSRYEWIVIISKQRPATRRVPLSSWRGTIQSVYVGPPQRNNEHADIHGATFPVHLPTWVIGDLCNRAAGVVDCCCGTGTTIVAAEQLGRRCYAIEIEPLYVDVAVRRWQKLTGKEAVHEQTGKTWAEMATERGVSVE